jgi:3-oxoacyl-[acyl-carrier protein] reductase
MEISLKGKHAVVCGSTQGIGKAIALQMANAGATVTLVARNEQRLLEVLSLLSVKEGQNHNMIVADFSDPGMLEKKIQEFLKQNLTVHILVNNTGGPSPGLLFEAKEYDLLNAFSQHIICNHILAKAFIPSMKEANYGRIINIISTSVKEPIPNLGVSNTVRGSVANWAKTLSYELASFGITVNNILPGFTKTQRLDSLIELRSKNAGKSVVDIEKEMIDQIPAKRFGTPEELSYLASFLASPLAAYINGVSIPVDGGKTKTH